MTHDIHLDNLFTAAYKGHDHSRVSDSSIHVSDLINFCPREYWLCRKHDRAYHQHRYGSMQDKWTWDIGHAYQRIQVERLMTQQVIFGSWECRHCHLLEVGTQEANRVCPSCKGKAWQYKDLGIEILIPVKIDGKKMQIRIVGHIDFVVLLSTMLGYIVDAKSIKAEDFDKLMQVAVEYRRQVQLYMWLGSHPKRKIIGSPRDAVQIRDIKFDSKRAVVCYACKGARMKPIKPMLVQQDPKFIKEIESKLKELVKSLETNKEPKKICKAQYDQMAKACACRGICFGQENTGA
jgi:hypothetical protein